MQDTRSTRLVYRSPFYRGVPISSSTFPLWNPMQLSGACCRHFSNSPNYGGPSGNLPGYLSLALVLLGLDWGFVSDWIVAPASVGWFLSDGFSGFVWAGLAWDRLDWLGIGGSCGAHKSAFWFPAARVACACRCLFGHVFTLSEEAINFVEKHANIYISYLLLEGIASLREVITVE